MGLGLAGAISGAGNAMTQGLQTLNSGIVQMGINQSLAKNDREFQLKKLEMQQEFERGMQTEKIAADRENTKERISLEGIEQRKTARLNNTAREDAADADRAAAKERQDAELASRQMLEMTKLGVLKQTNDEQLAEFRNYHNNLTDIQKQHLRLEKGKLQTFITDKGYIAMMEPDGKSAGYFVDKTGEPYVVQKDMPQSAVVDANNVMQQMKTESETFAKNILGQTDEGKRAHAIKMQELKDEFDKIVGPYRKNRATPSATKEDDVVMPSYKDKGAKSKAAPQSTPLPGPLKTPSNVTTAPPGAAGALRGLVPGLGMIENYLKK